LGVSGGEKGLGKGLFGVILCVAFPNLLLRGLGYRDLGSGGVFLGILGIFGGFGGGKGLENILGLFKAFLIFSHGL
jgi:hypothetical protein